MENDQHIIESYLQFQLGSELFAVDLLAVKEVLTLTRLTHIPEAPDYVRGLFDLRGEVLMLVDLKKRLKINSAIETKETGIIIFEHAQGTFGVSVDNILRVLNVPATQIQFGGEEGYIRGIIKDDDDLIVLLDPTKIISPNKLALCKAA